MNLKIDNELRDIIPPLAEDEFKQLEKNILNEGWRTNERILTWNGFIIDGHNRYDVCTKNNIGFKTLEMSFKNKEEVKLWMIDNQKGRRNLTDGWKFELAQHKKKILEAKGKENMSMGGQGLSNIDNPSHTREELSKELGWSAGKVAEADVVWKEAKPEVKEEVKKGEKSIHQVYSEIKKAKKDEAFKEKIKKQEEELAKEKPKKKEEKKYDVVVIDPPWPYGREYDSEGSRVANPYPEMSIAEIRHNVPSHNDDCIMFMWTTHRFIEEAIDIVQRWGFEKKAIMVWDKEKMGMGSWVRMQCEFCILATKGNPQWNIKDVRDIIREPRTKHSVKPEALYNMIDNRLSKEFIKLDFYARKKREGWDVYGDEV